MISIVVLGERNVIIAIQENLEPMSLTSVNFQMIVMKEQQNVNRNHGNMGGKSIEKVRKQYQKGVVLEVAMIIGLTRETIDGTIEITGRNKVDR